MKRKFYIAILLSVFIGLSLLAPSVCAQSEASAKVTVTISDGNGNTVISNETVAVSDNNGDGKLTLDEALYCAHKKAYRGDTDGYSSENGAYGIYMTKLWGDECGSYGYCVNDVPAMSLSDEIKNGDRIYAYVYSDTTAFSDSYSYFDFSEIIAVKDVPFELTLYRISYDENFNTVILPVENALITVDGKITNFKTNEDGKVKIMLRGTKNCVISAVADDVLLVPPVCSVDYDEGISNTIIIIIAVCVIVLFAAIIFIRKKLLNEK